MKVDGGMSLNNLFLQIQADVLGEQIQRAKHVETTGLGAAYLAALGAGIFENQAAVTRLQNTDRIFMPAEETLSDRQAWASSVKALLEMP
jgi:glycerol kinase